jgi:hypothetical protein
LWQNSRVGEVLEGATEVIFIEGGHNEIATRGWGKKEDWKEKGYCWGL